MENTQDQLVEKMTEELQNALTDEAMAKLKKKMIDAVIDIGDELEYNLKDSLANNLAARAMEMADASIDALLRGDETTMRFHLKSPEGGYTGRDCRHSVIRGELFETGGVEVRKNIVNLHADLLKNERILDLEDQVTALIREVADLTWRNEEMSRRSH